MASEVIKEIDASKGEIDAFISMCPAGIQEDASVKDEPARLSWKPDAVKGIERRTIGIEAAGKEIDAAIPVMHDDTKGLPSRSIDERSGVKGMRHDRTGQTGGTFGFLSAPTCFTARRKELDVGLDAFQADSTGMADEAKSFTARGRGITSEATCFSMPMTEVLTAETLSKDIAFASARKPVRCAHRAHCLDTRARLARSGAQHLDAHRLLATVATTPVLRSQPLSQ
jgi:hypothetical protein